MSELIEISASQLPAHIQRRGGRTNEDLVAGASVGYKVLSIKGKTFSVLSGDQREIIYNPKDPEQPAHAVDVVLARASKHISKMYYEKTFQEGEPAGAPDCFSLDGITPSPLSEKQQSESCATCPHNQWGSRITESGKKGKKCQDCRRVAVAPPSNLDDLMLLRVPPKSLKALAEYGRKLASKGIDYQYVVTRISFVPEAASPQLVFKAVAFLPPEACDKVDELYDDERTLTIIGMDGAAVAPDPDLVAENTTQEPVEAPEPPKPEPVAEAAAEPVLGAVESPPAAEPVAETSDVSALDLDDDSLSALKSLLDDD